jgi:hypothetical protein
MVWNWCAEPPVADWGFWSNIIGSLNSCSPPIVERITVNTTTGWIMGTVIRHSCRHGPAPSTAAASYTSLGIVCMAER